MHIASDRGLVLADHEKLKKATSDCFLFQSSKDGNPSLGFISVVYTLVVNLQLDDFLQFILCTLNCGSIKYESDRGYSL